MKEPETPPDESGRLRALEALAVMDTAPEPEFDQITRLAADLLGVPIALVSLVDAERQWFKSRVGLGATETPRSVSFCGHAVAAHERLIVPDALDDERFADNPLVVNAPNVRFYAGVPLESAEGHALGTLCVIDHQPRELSESEIELLALLARQVSSQLQLRRQRAEAAFFSMTLDLLCIAGFDGYFKSLNPSWPSLLGWTMEELLSRPFMEFVVEEDRAQTLAETSRLGELAAHQTVAFTNRWRKKDGEHVWLSWTAVRDVSGQLMYAVARDVTERRRIDEMKNEFVSVVSHELRTPLTSIRGSLRLVQSGMAGDLPDKAAKLVNIAASNTDRLVRLINDILDLEKLDAGKMELSLSPQPTAGLLEGAMTAVQGFAAEARVSLELSSTAPAHVIADADRLMQVLINLLSNAIKFSPPGATVELGAIRRKNRVRFFVKDEGPGISRSDQLKLFGKFQQLDSTDARSVGGTGLGLAISKAIVEQHGGTIGVESTVGAGSEFYFDCPAVRNPTPVVVNPPRGAKDETPRHSVLIVEDDAHVVHVLTVLLSGEGYRVRAASSVAGGRAALKAEVPDAMLLDLGLNDGDGLELLRWARREQSLADLPVVVISGRDPEGQDFGDALLVDWLAKPLEESALIGALRRSVREPGRARVLVVEDDPDTRDVIAAQLEAYDADVRFAGDGETAIELAHQYSPDLIVLDVGLPELDGFDVVEVLKRNESRTTPLIVYSGRDLSSGERHALRLGMTRHLTKARTTEDELLAAVRDLLSGVLDSRRPPERA